MARNDNLRRSTQDRPPPPSPPKKKSRFRRFMRSLFIWGGALFLLAVIIVGAAVMVTAQSLPTFNDMKSSQNAQTIVVRARDGTELISLGPSYGKWLKYNQIPQVMRDAMVSVEDRRFRSHFGVDPIGIARAAWIRDTEGS